jgi:hypothetical protein
MHKTHAQDACIRRMHDAILLRPLSLQQVAHWLWGRKASQRSVCFTTEVASNFPERTSIKGLDCIIDRLHERKASTILLLGATTFATGNPNIFHRWLPIPCIQLYRICPVLLFWPPRRSRPPKNQLFRPLAFKNYIFLRGLAAGRPPDN